MTFGTGLRTLDAIHLAVAFSNGFVLVTADRTLAAAAKALNVKYTLIS
jgi:predicted nucleic acid-binding protein